MYKKFNLYGFNPNLSNLKLNFDGRSDKEAKSILLFLESHLGYKKFGFHSLKEYGGNDSDASNSTPHRKTLSFFYCPEWTHTFNYKNNHSISATFIECMDY
jgi:phage-related protein